MRSLKRLMSLAGLLCVAVGCLAAVSCAKDKTTTISNPGEDVSTLPWTRPASWEGNPYGSMFPGSQ